MKKILLPTDFSKNSINAINYAVSLFKDIACEFYLLNVYRVPYLANEAMMDQDFTELRKVEKEMDQESKRGLKKLMEELPKNKKHHFEMISDFNLFSLAVHQVVDERDIDLIIMGTKGATGAREIFMGTNTSDVIMRNACNVIAVPENLKFKAPKEILFPTDFSIWYKFSDLEPLISLASMNHSIVRIVHFAPSDELSEDQKENKQNLSSLLEGISHEYFTVNASNFEEGINCFTQSRGNIDMILIVGRHYGFFERLFFRPKVKALSFHSRIPLYVIHHTNE